MLRGEALAALVQHLQRKWQSLNEAYLRLPCVVDTPSKKRRKEVGEGDRGERGVNEGDLPAGCVCGG